MNIKKKLIEFVFFSVFLNIIVGIFIFQITAGISYSISDTFYSEVENLNNRQIELYILKQYNEDCYSIIDLFQIINSDFSTDEKYQVMVILVHSIQAKNTLNIQNILHLWSFYILILLIIGYIFFLKNNFINIEEIERFKDKEYCDAYINSQGLPILMKQLSREAKEMNTLELCKSLTNFHEVLK